MILLKAGPVKGSLHITSVDRLKRKLILSNIIAGQDKLSEGGNHTMMRGLYSGVSGLQTHQIKMDVIGDNIANINTTAFKRNEVVFTDFISEMYEIAHGPEGYKGGTGPSQIGLGSQIGSMTTDHRQGAMNRTDRKLDVGIQGSGYFVIKDGDALNYTRNGHFELDADGTIVYAPGLKVQGWQAEQDEVTGEYRIDSSTKPIGDLSIKIGDIIPARATTTMEFNGNLDADRDIAIDPITVEWNAGTQMRPTNSKIKIVFEHCHPTLPYYEWKAVWAENPPAGFEIGDDVIDQNTGEGATGIIQLNEQGKVIGNFINTNQEGIANASIPVSASTNGAGNIKLDKVEVRNQYDITNALWKVKFEKYASAPGGTETFDPNKYNLYISTDNGINWTKVTNIKDTNQNSISIGDIRANSVFNYTVEAPNDRKMYGQLTILASSWSGEASVGDEINFTTSSADTTTDFNAILNLPTEKPKEEDDWQAMVASKPIADGNNDSDSGELKDVIVQRSVKVYTPSIDTNGGLTGAQTVSSAPTAVLNFSASSPTSNPYVTVDGYVSPGSKYRIKLDDNYDGTSNKKFYIMDAYTLSTIAQGEVGKDFNQYGVYIPAGAWNTTVLNSMASPAGKYLEFQTTTIDPGPRNYKIVFNDSETYNLLVYDSSAPGAVGTWKTLVSNQKKNDDLDLEKMILAETASASTANIDNDTVKIPWTNWSGTFTKDDTFYFSSHRAVSDQPGHRDFFRVKDVDGNITEIFIPSGSLTGSDPITFTPNTTETATASDRALEDAVNIAPLNVGPIEMGIALGGNPVTASMNNLDEYQYVTNVNVYDSLGRAHNLPITFERKDTNLWMWSINDPTPDDPNNVGLAGYGTIAFKEDGSYDAANSITFSAETGLQTPSPGGPVPFQGIYFDPSNWGGAPMPDSGAAPVQVSPDFSDLVQFASTTDAEVFSQDGYAKGTLTDYAINTFGIITGLYDNGHAQDIGQIALANFNNAGGLLKAGNSLYRTTSNSGHARVGVAGTAGRGTMASGNLEQSNVDLSREFTEMITTQRGFQANSRTITTEDQMLQELLSLKR